MNDRGGSLNDQRQVLRAIIILAAAQRGGKSHPFQGSRGDGGFVLLENIQELLALLRQLLQVDLGRLELPQDLLVRGDLPPLDFNPQIEFLEIDLRRGIRNIRDATVVLPAMVEGSLLGRIRRTTIRLWLGFLEYFVLELIETDLMGHIARVFRQRGAHGAGKSSLVKVFLVGQFTLYLHFLDGGIPCHIPDRYEVLQLLLLEAQVGLQYVIVRVHNEESC